MEWISLLIHSELLNLADHRCYQVQLRIKNILLIFQNLLIIHQSNHSSWHKSVSVNGKKFSHHLVNVFNVVFPEWASLASIILILVINSLVFQFLILPIPTQITVILNCARMTFQSILIVFFLHISI